MVYNATILRIDTPGPADAGGKVAWTAGAGIQCRCCVSEPTARDRYAGFGLEEEASLILRVLLRDLASALGRPGPIGAKYPAGFAIAAEQRITVLPDKSSTPVYYRVRQVVTQPHGSGSVVVAEIRAD